MPDQNLVPNAGQNPAPTSIQKNQPATPSASSPQATAAPSGRQVPLLKLHAALNEGLMRSPRVAAQRALLGITKAMYAAATVMPNPVIYDDSAAISEQTFRHGVISTYDLPWKIAFRLLAAKRQFKETKLEILTALWQFRNDIRRAFTELTIAQETYDTLHDLYDLAARLLEVSQKRFHAGDVPELDVLRAQLALSQTSIDLTQGARRIIKAQQALNVIVGREVELSLYVPRLPIFNARAERTELLPDFNKEVPPLRQFIDEAMENRLELKVLKAQIKVAQAQLYNSIGNIIPDPTLSGGPSITNNAPSGPQINAYFFTWNVETPVFNWQQGDIARLRATIKQYYAQVGAQKNLIISDVSQAYNDLIIARGRIRTYQEHVLADSAEVARLARRSYEVGQSDITSTLLAQQANVQVRSMYLDAIMSYQQALTSLEQSVGEPLE